MAKSIPRKQKPSFLSRKLLVIIGVLVGLCSVIGVLEVTNVTHFLHTAATESPAAQDAQYNRQKKESVLDNGGNPTDTNSATKGATGGTYTTPTSSDNITVTATKSGSDQVVVSTKLAGYSDGSCSLHVSNGNKVNDQTAQVIYAPNFSTCAGFSVPISQLGSGTWSISLTVTSGGVTTTKNISYEVSNV